MKMKKIDIREIDGFRLGNAENAEAGTGVTVVIAEDGAVGGVDVRGGGPATRETDLLRSENTVDKVHAVVLSGGSAFGLEAASGVMRSLASRKIGFRADEDIFIPIVPGASLYDLPIGRSDIFPDVEMGKEAVENAYAGVFSSGNHGAGTGATVGKYMGYARAMKTGLGTFACGDDHIQVGAVAAVNAVGDIYNGAGNIIAGLRTLDGESIKGTIRVLKGMVHDESSPDLDLSDIRTIAAAEALKKSADVDTSYRQTGIEEKPEETVPAGEAEKDDIVKAMMDSYNKENPPAVEDEYLDIPDEESAADTEEPAQEPAEDKHAVQEPASEEQEAEEVSQPEVSVSEPVTEEKQEEFPVQVNMEQEIQEIGETPEKPEAGTTYEEPVNEVAEEEHAAEETAQELPDEYILTEEDKADMGYDIPFNTVISCVITNADLTKAQANKLASILHDAYARAVKPVHGTLDGDTVFVLSTCTQKVNFDAFAALATDVLQYAVIDGAMSAEGAYGLPAARDMIIK